MAKIAGIVIFYHNKQLVSKLVNFVFEFINLHALSNLKLVKQSKVYLLRQSGAKLITRDLVLASPPSLWPNFPYCIIAHFV